MSSKTERVETVNEEQLIAEEISYLKAVFNNERNKTMTHEIDTEQGPARVSVADHYQVGVNFITNNIDLRIKLLASRARVTGYEFLIHDGRILTLKFETRGITDTITGISWGTDYESFGLSPDYYPGDIESREARIRGLKWVVAQMKAAGIGPQIPSSPS